MYHFSRLFIGISLLIIFSSFCFESFSQADKSTTIADIYRIFDAKYGLNQGLYNGIKYVPEHTGASGSPFFYEKDDTPDRLILSGAKYDNLDINYNIYRQIFILNFKDRNGGEKQLILNSEQIDTVVVNDDIFIKNPFSHLDEKFVQLIYSDRITCFYTWTKNYQFVNNARYIGYEYSKAYKKSYIIFKGNVYSYKNTRTFLKIFPNYSSDIRKFLNKNNIKLKSGSVGEIKNVLNYCNKIVYK